MYLLLLVLTSTAVKLNRHLSKLISPWTKWLPFRRQYFQMQFNE